MREWLLRQQSTREHPFTHAAPGAWAWTPLSGGVPDADDTPGALVALASARRAGVGDGGRRGGGRALAARRPEPRRWHADVLPRLGDAAVRSEYAGNHRPRDPRLERVASAPRSVAAARADACRCAVLVGLPRGHAASRRRLDSAVVRQRARARRGQRRVRHCAGAAWRSSCRWCASIRPRRCVGAAPSPGCCARRTPTAGGAATAESRRPSRRPAWRWRHLAASGRLMAQTIAAVQRGTQWLIDAARDESRCWRPRSASTSRGCGTTRSSIR